MWNEDKLILSDYIPRSELVVEEHWIDKPKFPVFDVHGHFGALYSDLYSQKNKSQKPDVDQTVESLKAYGVRKIVNLDGFWDGFHSITLAKVFKTLEKHSDFFVNFVSVNTNRVNEPGFADSVRDHLQNAKSYGIAGIKLFKNVSLNVEKDGKYIPGRNISIDDPRLKVIWETAAELKMPVLAHIGDPVAFFRPVDRLNERYEQLLVHPDWSFYGPGMYTFADMMQMQENLLADNPETIFIIPHGGGYSENLGYVGQCLDKYPNMYIDLAARVSEFGRQPYTSRKFFIKYQDRILFGTDEFAGGKKRSYPFYYRFLETYDEYFPHSYSPYSLNGRWGLYGIGLDDQILEKIYYKNAENVLRMKL